MKNANTVNNWVLISFRKNVYKSICNTRVILIIAICDLFLVNFANLALRL